jgi:excisionase family DNA binding protein
MRQRATVSIVEAAAYLCISRQAVHQAIAAGRLRVVRVGGEKRIRAADLAAYVPRVPRGKGRQTQTGKETPAAVRASTEASDGLGGASRLPEGSSAADGPVEGAYYIGKPGQLAPWFSVCRWVRDPSGNLASQTVKSGLRTEAEALAALEGFEQEKASAIGEDSRRQETGEAGSRSSNVR